MHVFYYHISEPHCHEKVHKVQLHYMVTDFFVLSFDTDVELKIEFLHIHKDECDLCEFNVSSELYDPFNKKVIRKTKIERSPVLALKTFSALLSKSYNFSDKSIPNSIFQKPKQKGNTKNSSIL